MNITILTPEEEILVYFEKAMTEELLEIIKNINEEQGESWIKEIEDVSKIQNTSSMLPNAAMTISKVKKKTVDINFIKEEYLLSMTITFREDERRITGYRYNYLVNRLIKSSIYLKNIADKIVIEEMEYRQNKRGDNREPASILLKIIVTRETS